VVVAGVPPDYFSKNGQLWGNPLYRWDQLRKSHYKWWLDRFQLSIDRFDATRLDHFIGFHRVWAVKASAKTARHGKWMKGPGEHFFNRLLATFPRLQLIVEDLGVLTPEVISLRDKFRFPGIHVLQFAFGNPGEPENHLPRHYPARSVVYTGTHDNDTTVGWFNDVGSASNPRTAKQIFAEREHVKRYLQTEGENIHWDMIELAQETPANTAIIPLQDVLGLGSSARMNRPGSSSHNWEWRMNKHALSKSISKKLLSLTKKHHRIP
jgi:4-alpha-glucanotransferase